jgi:putative CocE/NonD family hydrolase
VELASGATVAALALGFAASAASGASAAGASPGNGSWHPDHPRYSMSSERTDVRMSDGITLSATVTRPADPASGQPVRGSFPVLLTITPYGKDEPAFRGVNVTPAADYVPYGYIDVVVDARGTGSSGGSFELFGPREVQDSVELIGWAAHVPGSDGRVGMVGESSLGLSQLYAAGAVGPGSPLKAIFPIDVGSDLYRDLVVPGGMFNSLFGTPYAGLEIGMDTLGPVSSGQQPSQAAQDVGLHLAGNAEIDGRTLADAFDGGDRAYDQDFYRQRDLSAAIARIPANGVAVFAYNAWFDIWQRGDPLVYSILQNAAGRRPPLAAMPPGQPADPRYQVVLGPYVHAQSGELLAGTLGLLSLEWFDTWLKGERTGMADTATPLHAYELQGGRWTDTTSWPPSTGHARTLYFAAGPSGSGAPSLNDGKLAEAPPQTHGSDHLFWNGGFNSPCTRETYQQTNATDFISPASENPCFYDDRSFEIGALTYTSAPLAQPLDLAGPSVVSVYASANRPNSEWVVTLDDVAPDHSARPLVTGDLVGSLRALDRASSWTLDGRLLMPWHAYTRASEQPVGDGALERYDIELPGTIARIARGDRIRVTVQSSDAPYLEPIFPDQSQLSGGSYDVQRGGPQPSSVTFAALPPGDLSTSPVDWGACVTDCGTRDLSAEQLRTPRSPSPSPSRSRAMAGCRRQPTLVLRAPRLRRGERIGGVRVWIDGHRLRSVLPRARLLVPIPARRVRVRVVWLTDRGRRIVRRTIAHGCSPAPRARRGQV